MINVEDNHFHLCNELKQSTTYNIDDLNDHFVFHLVE